MEWIKCSDRLPIQMPEAWPTFDWVVVASLREGTNEPCPWYIARYTDKGWEFHDNKKDDLDCPDFSDTWASMNIDEITHWMKLPKLPKE